MIHMSYFLIYFSHKFSVSSTSLTNLNYILCTHELCKVKKIKIVAENRSILKRSTIAWWINFFIVF